VPAVSPLNDVPLRHPLVGAVDTVAMVIAYCADCPVVVGESVTAPTVIEFCVGVPLTAGVDTVAPSPIATALVESVAGVTDTLEVAPVTLANGTADTGDKVAPTVEEVVGAPLMAMVTTVLLVRTAAAALSPAGRPSIIKCDAVIDEAYVPLESVYTMLAPLTA